MSEKCPHCGEEKWSHGRPGFKCRTIGMDQSDLCMERAEHAETRKDRDTWHSRYEAQKQAAEFAELGAKRAESELQCSRAKWARLREWASKYSHRMIAKWEIDRLDAEEKDGK